MKFNKEMLILYGITDRSLAKEKSLYEQIEDALKGGVTMLQLREKDLNPEDFLKEAKEVKKLCEKFGVPLIINDNLDVALKSGADGVHVGSEDLPVSEIRKIVPENFIIGATAKTVEQAKKAEESGADYIGVGAVFPSPTKKNAIRITVEQLNEICTSVLVPAVAIGGIGIHNLDELKNGKMKGVALVSAIFSAEDIVKTTALLKEKVRNIILKGE